MFNPQEELKKLKVQAHAKFLRWSDVLREAGISPATEWKIRNGQTHEPRRSTFERLEAAIEKMPKGEL